MKPSDHLKIGECPFCCGTGEIESLIYGMHACPLCSGTKRWPPPEEEWEKMLNEQPKR
jgi:hypothetical protein